MVDMSKQFIPAFPDRPIDAHKGTFGTVLSVGGSAGMIGAPTLVATAALRIGAGLVRIACARELVPFCLTIEPCATGIELIGDADAMTLAIERACDEKSVLAIGPGMGVGPVQQALVESLLRLDRPAVLDADGLNNLSRIADATVVPRCPLVMTPHPGEFARLAQAARVRADPTDPQQRVEAATGLAKAFGAVVVLKGWQTVVSDGERSYINQTGNPALATAGSGDVLTGAIGGLLAQGMAIFDAAVLGVYLHGLAADLWMASNGTAGLRASDLAAHLPLAIRQHSTKGA